MKRFLNCIDAQVFTAMEAATERCKALDAAKRSAMFEYLSHCHVDVLSALQVGLGTHLTHGRRVHGSVRCLAAAIRLLTALRNLLRNHRCSPAHVPIAEPGHHTLVTESCDACA